MDIKQEQRLANDRKHERVFAEAFAGADRPCPAEYYNDQVAMHAWQWGVYARVTGKLPDDLFDGKPALGSLVSGQ
jgi:hypothetical protein